MRRKWCFPASRTFIKGSHRENMADLTPFKNQIETALKNVDFEYADPRSAFLNAIQEAGFDAPNNLLIGKIMRFDSPEDKNGDKSGWAIYYEFPDQYNPGKIFSAGIFGSWKEDAPKVNWSSKSQNSMTMTERFQYNEAIEKARKAHEVELLKQYEEAAIEANNIICQANPADADHPYIKRKQVNSLKGIRQTNDGILIIPMSYNEEVRTLEYINKDGKKWRLKGGCARGAYFRFDGDNSTVYITEGWATGASVHEATGATVYVSFNAGNLYEVVSYAKNRHEESKIVIAADDDITKPSNTGRAKAIQVAEGLRVDVVFPTVIKDFNDQAVKEGLESVKKTLTMPIHKAYEKPEEKPQDNFIPPIGALRDLYDFYNMTSGNVQHGFAIQTALAIGSVVCSRSYKTNFTNFSSLYLLNVAKSSTGKEHGKTVVEQVLGDCNMPHLIGGDGYTSGGAVFSAMLDRPRHISVIDELGRYLSASNSNGNHHQKEANTKLMEAIGRCHSIMRPPTYSTMTLKKDRADNLKNRVVYNPAVTILSMTTPVTFFNEVGLESIKDGFINRFVVSISDAKKDIRRHKPMLQTPQRIIDWVNAINARVQTSHIAAEPPQMVTLNFTDAANNVQEEFQRYCIEQSDKLEKFGMAELSGRTNEMAMRISLIVALSRNPNAELIEKEDIEWACKYMRRCLEQTINVLKMNVSGSEYEGFKKEILHSLREASPEWIRRTNMNKMQPYSKHKTKDLNEILDALVDSGTVEERSCSGVGRPTKEYRAIT